MDTELLKTFLEVSRTRHFGRAAESLYLTQSAVSFRIRQLENQLGESFHPPQKQYPFNRCRRKASALCRNAHEHLAGRPQGGGAYLTT